eukprot:3550046-Karenia_brevis.AAC.1
MEHGGQQMGGTGDEPSSADEESTPAPRGAYRRFPTDTEDLDIPDGVAVYKIYDRINPNKFQWRAVLPGSTTFRGNHTKNATVDMSGPDYAMQNIRAKNKLQEWLDDWRRSQTEGC